MADKKLPSKKAKGTRKPAAKKTVQSTSKATAAVSTIRHAPGISSIQTLFQESWTLWKSTITAYIKLVLLGVGLLSAIGFVGLMIALPLMVSSSGSASDLLSSPSLLQVIGITLAIVWAIVSFVAVYAFFVFVPIASILIVSSSEHRSIGSLLTKSKPLLLPYFLASLLSAVIIIGGWTVFVLPGIVFALFFAFVGYSVVLEGKKGQAALQSSYQMVRAHFWKVLLRVLVVQAIIFVGTFLLDTIAEEVSIFSLISFVFSLAAGWYTQVYLYLLYKQLRPLTPTANGSLKWVWIVAAIGLVLLLWFTYIFFTSGMEFLDSSGFMQPMYTDPSSSGTI